MSRTRSKPTEVILTNLPSGQQSTITGAWSTGGPSVAFTSSLRSFEMTDVVTPGFERIRSRGGVVMSPMSSITRQVSASYGTTMVRNTSANTRLYRQASAASRFLTEPVPASISSQASSLQTEAATLARSRVASSDAALLVSYAERAETLAMLRQPVTALVRATRDLDKVIAELKRRKASRPEIVKTISNWWLLYRYGILPLMSDVEGVMKALSKTSEPKRETARGQASGSATIVGSPTTVGPGWGLTETTSYSEVWDIAVRAGCLYQYESTLSSRLGLALGDIPRSAYDLVTMSFVLDWFVNVGDYIGAVTADLRGDILGAWVTTDLTCTRASQCVTTWSSSGGAQYVAEALGVGNTLTTTIWRSRAPTGIGSIGIVPRVQMNTARYADAFALLYGRLSGGLKRAARRF